MLSHACGAALRQSDLIVAAVVEDSESRHRPTGDLLAHQQVSEPDSGWRGTANPPPEWLAKSIIQLCFADHVQELEEDLMRGYGWTLHFRGRLRP